MFFVYKGTVYYSYRKFCIDNHVRYSASRYALKSFYKVKTKLQVNTLLLSQPDILDTIIDRYGDK